MFGGSNPFPEQAPHPINRRNQMKRSVMALMLLALFCGSAFASGGLDNFLGNLNIQARSDLTGFSARVSAQFGVPVAQVSATIGTVREPADAFMVFQLGHMTGYPPERVMEVYERHRGKGWGVIAKSLGIKPGSPEFHALKRGDFALTGEPSGGTGNGHGKGKGKGKKAKK
jgi:hypothetical protein